jgi:hypothetical protein
MDTNREHEWTRIEIPRKAAKVKADEPQMDQPSLKLWRASCRFTQMDCRGLVKQVIEGCVGKRRAPVSTGVIGVISSVRSEIFIASGNPCVVSSVRSGIKEHAATVDFITN